MKTCMIIQSGTMSDIFVVAPIANHYYKRGYNVYWPVRDRYVNLVKNYFPYVDCIPIQDLYFKPASTDWLRSDALNLHTYLRSNNYDLVIDTANKLGMSNQGSKETFEQYKYRVAKVPFAFKNHLDWKRNMDKESDLQAIIEANYGIDLNNDHYVVAHVNDSFEDVVDVPDYEVRPCIYVTSIDGFEIPDWYSIFVKAKAIYAVESAVHQFVDGAINRLKYDNDKLEFYLLSRSPLGTGEQSTVSKGWSKKYMK